MLSEEMTLWVMGAAEGEALILRMFSN